MIYNSRVTILVKASPQPSDKHNETVCCAGIDDEGHWKRLFPLRFRQLTDDKVFKRWSTVSFQYSLPTHDKRFESCRVHEESISVVGRVTAAIEKSDLVERVVVSSEKAAADSGASLALIRPSDVKFTWQRRTEEELSRARDKFAKKAAQASFFDKELAAYEPVPFKFIMKYRDGSGPHTKECADWETSAAFFNLSKRYGEEQALDHLKRTYTQEYVDKGIVFALGNMMKRPQTWQLLGIFPAEPSGQALLF